MCIPIKKIHPGFPDVSFFKYDLLRELTELTEEIILKKRYKSSRRRSYSRSTFVGNMGWEAECIAHYIRNTFGSSAQEIIALLSGIWDGNSEHECIPH